MITVMGFSGHFCAEAGPTAPAVSTPIRARVKRSLRMHVSLLLPLACR